MEMSDMEPTEMLVCYRKIYSQLYTAVLFVGALSLTKFCFILSSCRMFGRGVQLAGLQGADV